MHKVKKDPFHWLMSIKELSILNVKFLKVSKIKQEANRSYQGFLEQEYQEDSIFEKVLFSFFLYPLSSS